MANILVVEDSPTQAASIQQQLETLGHTVRLAETAEIGLELLAKELPDLLLTDMNLPGISGMDLIEEVSRQYPKLPPILMTSQGNEDIAVDALRKGAVSYIPKRRLDIDLPPTIQSIVGSSRLDRRHQQLMACCQQYENLFVIGNETHLIPAFISYVGDLLAGLRFTDDKTITRMGIALTECLDNALHHGNLELKSELREGDGTAWREEGARRMRTAPYKDRRIFITARVSRKSATFIIRDEGPGFDVSKLPDPTDPSNLEKCSGRGILLMRAFMDDARYNSKGNEITLVKSWKPE
ncbi:MAG: response regulator [Zavarzinella sp.]